MRLGIPISEDLTDELTEFWDCIFGQNPDVTRGVFLGDEVRDNHNLLYVDRRNGKIAGTCLLTTSQSVSGLACFGEVATDPIYRRSGIATELVSRAVSDFKEKGGGAIFLGTSNSNAARIYYRHGWRYLSGSGTMANITNGDSPEEYLVNYFHEVGTTTVRTGSAIERVPMIPLIHTPHDWQVLDSNASQHIYSTRYAKQVSCNGLYPRYETVRSNGRGNWFAANTNDGRVVGLATTRLTNDNSSRVDGFTHKRHIDAWPKLIQTAARWGINHGNKSVHALLSVEDEEKQAAFEAMGFKLGTSGKPFTMGEREVSSVRMDLKNDEIDPS
ncbi:MAG: GNAT family N-acetyltransferase [SAR202 cluster bacterium]|jgi:GNAT superfamily N-acetyltransferase|nr:GNAT family N-acetyltransferase [SAR202 cluster bacterium]